MSAKKLKELIAQWNETKGTEDEGFKLKQRGASSIDIPPAIKYNNQGNNQYNNQNHNQYNKQYNNKDSTKEYNEMYISQVETEEDQKGTSIHLSEGEIVDMNRTYRKNTEGGIGEIKSFTTGLSKSRLSVSKLQ